MSKKADTKIVVNHNVVKRARKKVRVSVDWYERPWTIDNEAWCIFMIDDYLTRHPRPSTNSQRVTREVGFAGQLEWKKMSARDKAPFIKKVRERKAKPTYNHHGW